MGMAGRVPGVSNFRRPGPSRASAWVLFLLLLPLVTSACITVESDLLATPTPTVAPATPAASLTPVTIASPTPLPTAQPTPEPVEAEVLGFVRYDLLEQAATTIDPELVTVAAFHSVEAAGNGRLVSKKPNGSIPPGWQMLRSERFVEVQAELQAAGVKVVPVIQRAAWQDGTRKRTVELLSKKKNRRALVDNILAFIARRGFDGVNLDFEPVPAQVADDYVALVRELRAALDELDPELHLSVDVLPSLENYDLAALTADDAADLAVIMGYGYRTTASGTAGSTAPLDGLATTVDAALAQADAQRLLLALPWYGLDWATDSAAAGSSVRRGNKIARPSSLLYREARAQAARSGRAYDPISASAWTVYAARGCATCTPAWRQAWYEDPDGFAAKLELATDAGLAGVGVWTLGMESPHDELWLTLRNHLRPRFDEVPPGGSAALDPETVQGEIDGRQLVTGSAALRLFARDEEGGSGLGFVRIGLDASLDADGRLQTARTYPAVDRVDFPLGDESTGGSATEGPRTIHVQWRDLAGNWSVPLAIEAQVLKPVSTRTPADL